MPLDTVIDVKPERIGFRMIGTSDVWRHYDRSETVTRVLAELAEEFPDTIVYL